MKQLLNFTLLSKDTHAYHKWSELLLVKYTVLVQIKAFEVLVEFLKESFMFSKLEVKDNFLKILIK